MAENRINFSCSSPVAALYCRLSKDDERTGESVSIETQKMILQQFCVEQNIQIYNFYIDDGFSGLNFERPAFQQMLRDAESGLFNHVITKDLSRLGRDYLQTGYYTEVYFPQNHIRYIAIYDGIDTQIDSNEIAPFKNILNEMLPLRRVTVQQHQQIALGMNSMIGQLQMKHLSSSFFEM